MSLAPLMIMPMILFGGMFANNEELPEFLSYIQYISPIKYTAEALMWNEFSEDKYDLRDGIMEFIGYKLSYWKCILVFCGLFVLFRIITFISFKLLVRKF